MVSVFPDSWKWVFGLTVVAVALPAGGQSPSPAPAPLAYKEEVQVTATRIPEYVDSVPASIQVVTADELRERGATDLESALALIAGVDIAPGGDNGPASSVPGFWGLKEFDAFLLVVDGVPWGGAFNPALGTLTLNGVERIEIQRGPAPVMYGATSFVGVIQLVRRPPAEQGGQVSAWGGRRSSGGLAIVKGIPLWLGFESTLSGAFDRQGFKDERTGFDKGHLLWRNRRSWGESALRFDLNGIWLRQDPSSPTPREGPALSVRVPIDSNQNPAGAFLNEDRYFMSAGYDRGLSSGDWSTTLSFTRSGQSQFRGFLTDVSARQPNAAGFRAKIDQNDLYFDSHISWTRGGAWRAVAGVDYLFGKADAEGDTFDYGVSLDGARTPASIPPGQERHIEDTRHFAGLYTNFEWTPTTAIRLDAGVRLNRTEEERGQGEGEQAPEAGGDQERREVTRPSGGVGVTWTLWQHDGDSVHVFANWKNTFKPAAIDFNLAEDPAAEGENGILKPETSNSLEAGLKTEILGRKLKLEAAGFFMDLKNLVVSQSVAGLPSLTNAGSSRLKGMEFSAVWRIQPKVVARASYGHHDARFRDYLTQFDGVPTQLAGKRLEMSPHNLAGLALAWSPEAGPFASAELNYVGSRFLNKRNTAPAESYATLGGSIGYRKGRWEARVVGRNLSDQRDPVAESELGDAQYYRLFPRRLDASATVRF